MQRLHDTLSSHFGDTCRTKVVAPAPNVIFASDIFKHTCALRVGCALRLRRISGSGRGSYVYGVGTESRGHGRLSGRESSTQAVATSSVQAEEVPKKFSELYLSGLAETVSKKDVKHGLAQKGAPHAYQPVAKRFKSEDKGNGDFQSRQNQRQEKQEKPQVQEKGQLQRSPQQSEQQQEIKGNQQQEQQQRGQPLQQQQSKQQQGDEGEGYQQLPAPPPQQQQKHNDQRRQQLQQRRVYQLQQEQQKRWAQEYKQRQQRKLELANMKLQRDIVDKEEASTQNAKPDMQQQGKFDREASSGRKTESSVQQQQQNQSQTKAWQQQGNLERKADSDRKAELSIEQQQKQQQNQPEGQRQRNAVQQQDAFDREKNRRTADNAKQQQTAQTQTESGAVRYDRREEDNQRQETEQHQQEQRGPQKTLPEQIRAFKKIVKKVEQESDQQQQQPQQSHQQKEQVTQQAIKTAEQDTQQQQQQQQQQQSSERQQEQGQLEAKGLSSRIGLQRVSSTSAQLDATHREDIGKLSVVSSEQKEKRQLKGNGLSTTTGARQVSSSGSQYAVEQKGMSLRNRLEGDGQEQHQAKGKGLSTSTELRWVSSNDSQSGVDHMSEPGRKQLEGDGEEQDQAKGKGSSTSTGITRVSLRGSQIGRERSAEYGKVRIVRSDKDQDEPKGNGISGTIGLRRLSSTSRQSGAGRIAEPDGKQIERYEKEQEPAKGTGSSSTMGLRRLSSSSPRLGGMRSAEPLRKRAASEESASGAGDGLTQIKTYTKDQKGLNIILLQLRSRETRPLNEWQMGNMSETLNAMKPYDPAVNTAFEELLVAIHERVEKISVRFIGTVFPRLIAGYKSGHIDKKHKDLLSAVCVKGAERCLNMIRESEKLEQKLEGKDANMMPMAGFFVAVAFGISRTDLVPKAEVARVFKLANEVLGKEETCSTLNAQSVCILILACYYANQTPPLLLASLCRRVQFILRTSPEALSMRNFANVLLTFGKLNYLDKVTLKSVTDRLVFCMQQNVDSVNSQEIANAVWACAKLNYECPALFKFAARWYVDKSADPSVLIKPQEMTIVLWSFAKIGITDCKELFDTGIKYYLATLERDPGSLKCQDISNMLWSCSTINHVNQELYIGLANQLVKIMEEKQKYQMRQELANSLWACARAGVTPVPLFAAAAKYLSRNTFSAFQKQEVTNMFWAYATVYMASLNQEVKAAGVALCLMADKVSFAKELLAEGSPQSWSNILWSFSGLQYYSPVLWATLSKAVCKRGEFKAQECANLLLAQAGVLHLDVELACNLADRLLLVLEGTDAKELRHATNIQSISNSTWALAILGGALLMPVGTLSLDLNSVRKQVSSNTALKEFLSRMKRFHRLLLPVSPHTIEKRGMCQLFQSHLFLTLCGEPSGISDNMLKVARGIWREQLMHEISSTLTQKLVLKALITAGFKESELELEGWTEDKDMRVDVVLRFGKKREEILAIEVDGSYHFLSSHPDSINGSTHLRNLLLLARVGGLVVLRSEIVANSTSADIQQMLLKAIAESAPSKRQTLLAARNATLQSTQGSTETPVSVS